jgi:hypothetical protein
MKNYLVFGALIFMIVVVALPVWSQGMAETEDLEQELEYFILNQEGEIAGS